MATKIPNRRKNCRRPEECAYTYTVSICGGKGYRVWDAQITVTAMDIRDAIDTTTARCDRAADKGVQPDYWPYYWIVSVEQND